MDRRRYLTLAAATAATGCALAVPPPARVTTPRAEPATVPVSASAEIAAAVDGPPALLSFWLLAERGLWRSTLYVVDASGQLREEETVSVGAAPGGEATGTLSRIDGCSSPAGCQSRTSCSLVGRVLESLEGNLGDGCEPLRLTVESTCSDGVQRHIKLGFDDRCAAGDGAAAFVYVEGEPVFDGRNPGWERISHAVYLPCGSLIACRARLA